MVPYRSNSLVEEAQHQAWGFSAAEDNGMKLSRLFIKMKKIIFLWPTQITYIKLQIRIRRILIVRVLYLRRRFGAERIVLFPWLFFERVRWSSKRHQNLLRAIVITKRGIVGFCTWAAPENTVRFGSSPRFPCHRICRTGHVDWSGSSDHACGPLHRRRRACFSPHSIRISTLAIIHIFFVRRRRRRATVMVSITVKTWRGRTLIVLRIVVTATLFVVLSPGCIRVHSGVARRTSPSIGRIAFSVAIVICHGTPRRWVPVARGRSGTWWGASLLRPVVARRRRRPTLIVTSMISTRRTSVLPIPCLWRVIPRCWRWLCTTSHRFSSCGRRCRCCGWICS
jgi:hypothetical protein